MKTFILFWNPTISNDKGEARDLILFVLNEGITVTPSWAVSDWQDAHVGDRFYKVMVGNPDTHTNGIIESGHFASEPYIDTDWSGRGREVHYCKLEYDAYIDIDKIHPLYIEKLEQAIPNFKWTGGHSGCLLDEESADKLDKLWCEHLLKNGALDYNEDDAYLSDDMETHLLS